MVDTVHTVIHISRSNGFNQYLLYVAIVHALHFPVLPNGATECGQGPGEAQKKDI